MTERTAEQIAAAEFGCRYRFAYTYTPCSGLNLGDGFCIKHIGIECGSCGAQASYECSYCGQFVCGTPLCNDCEGWEDRSKASGSWGFLNHNHRVKPAVQAERDKRVAVAEDFGLESQVKP